MTVVTHIHSTNMDHQHLAMVLVTLFQAASDPPNQHATSVAHRPSHCPASQHLAMVLVTHLHMGSIDH